MKINPDDKIRACVKQGGEFTGEYLWWCPGCGEFHGVWTEEPNAYTGAKWSYNGDPIAPTFNPSILSEGRIRCHVFIRDGNIQYCGDSQHALAGKTVPMENIEQHLSPNFSGIAR